MPRFALPHVSGKLSVRASEVFVSLKDPAAIKVIRLPLADLYRIASSEEWFYSKQRVQKHPHSSGREEQEFTRQRYEEAFRPRQNMEFCA